MKVPANIDLLGKGIAKGICKFLNVEFRELPVTQPIPVPATPPTSVETTARTNTPPMQSAPAAQPVEAFNNNGAFGQQPNTTNGAFSPLPSREERRKMIITLYTKILGREPSQNDINYFLNVGIREDELIKKMMDSQEHADLVKSKQEFAAIKQEFETQRIELTELKSAWEDQSKVIEGLNYSIMQKNAALQSAQQNFNQTQVNVSAGISTPKGRKAKPPGYKGSFLDRLFKAFSDLFE